MALRVQLHCSRRTAEGQGNAGSLGPQQALGHVPSSGTPGADQDRSLQHHLVQGGAEETERCARWGADQEIGPADFGQPIWTACHEHGIKPAASMHAVTAASGDAARNCCRNGGEPDDTRPAGQPVMDTPEWHCPHLRTAVIEQLDVVGACAWALTSQEPSRMLKWLRTLGFEPSRQHMLLAADMLVADLRPSGHGLERAQRQAGPNRVGVMHGSITQNKKKYFEKDWIESPFGGLRAPCHLTPTQKTFWGHAARVLYYSAMAGVEDYTVLGLGVMPPVCHPTVCAEIVEGLGRAGIEEYQEWYPVVDRPTGAAYMLTLATLKQVLQRDWLPHEEDILAANHGHPEWSVAADILGTLAWEPSMLEWLSTRSNWFLMPLARKLDELKPWLNAVRRCPRLQGAPTSVAGLLVLRKYGNICGRNKSPAKWGEEELRRVRNLPVHYAIDNQGRLSRLLWEAQLRSLLQELATGVVASVVSSGDLQGPKEWWASRWKWVPTGSTSMRSRQADLCTADSRLGSGARADKRTVAETLPDDYLEQALSGQPVRVARRSTKHEPGLKNRALYAVDDRTFYVAAYASAYAEQHMVAEGMRAKQTPADVAEWMRRHWDRRDPAVWLSLDYSDFNSDHEIDTLVALDLAFARAWAASKTLSRDGEDISAAKAETCAWLAMSHRCNVSTGGDVASWVSDSSENEPGLIPPGYKGAWLCGDADTAAKRPWRVYGGLFSGDRNTARDNTMLHAVYSLMARKSMAHFWGGAMSGLSFTGDDEDGIADDWQTGLVYVLQHVLMQFELKAAKQMAGHNHEFLQRSLSDDGFPTRPLYAALAQLASGNWYQDVHMWYDAHIRAVSDNIWELHTRGMPYAVAQRLAIELLNGMMRVKVPEPERVVQLGRSIGHHETAALGLKSGQWKRLEWWSLRHGSAEGPEHPLWHNTEGPRCDLPAVAAKPAPHHSAPSQATEAWITRQKRRFGNVPDWDLYRASCLKSSYAGLYVRARADAHTAHALLLWPDRLELRPSGLNQPPPRADLKALQRYMMSLEQERHPRSLEDQLARIGMDPELASACGGLACALKLIPPRDMYKYSNLVRQNTVPMSVKSEDSAVQAWVANAAAVVPGALELRAHVWQPLQPGAAPKLSTQVDCTQSDPFPPPRIGLAGSTPIGLIVVFAPNGAGKSAWTLPRRWAMDYDEVVGGLGEKYARDHEQWRLHTGDWPALLDGVWRATQHGTRVLTTQSNLLAILCRSSTTFGQIATVVVQPDREHYVQRLRQRGWPQNRIDRRWDRWQQLVQDSQRWPKLHGTISLTDGLPDHPTIKDMQQLDLVLQYSPRDTEKQGICQHTVKQ
uniref:RNA-directed RNA polymerase n=1 Tax=Ahus virus TaxID=2651944 RepID=A0A5Q0TW34_9VIRU|nr:RNA-dependent RNA polymerase [Ahus virus]